MSELLTGQGDVWPALARTLTGTGRTGTNPAWAAIAYIGTSADTWLPLRARDTLICDASDRAVKLGLTDAAQLRRWHDAGVDLYSREGLHAKVATFGRRGLIGSANASTMSATQRNEAVLVTTEKTTVTGLRDYVKALRDSPSRHLDADELDRLAKLPVRRTDWPRGIPPSRPPVPERGRLYLWKWELDAWTPSEEKAAAAATTTARPDRPRTDRVDVVWVEAGDQLPQIGDVFCWSNPEQVRTWAPAVVEAHIPAGRGRRRGAVYVVRGDLRTLPTPQVEAAIRAAQPGWRRQKSTLLHGPARQAVADLPWYRERP